MKTAVIHESKLYDPRSTVSIDEPGVVRKLPTMPRTCRLVVALAAPLLLVAAACSSTDDSSDHTSDAATSTSTAAGTPTDIDTAFVMENLPIVAGNVITGVNNAREHDFVDDPNYPGMYDLGSYYDQMTPECKTRITRSAFRQDFRTRVVPMIDDARPERVTAQIGDGYNATATVEQTSGRTIVMAFVLEPGSNTGDHACNPDGTIDIRLAP